MKLLLLHYYITAIISNNLLFAEIYFPLIIYEDYYRAFFLS